MNQELQSVVATELEALDLDLVELRRGGTRSRPVVDVRIERRDGSGVTVDDCARASRAIEARIDESGVMGDRYVLEVSSPGVERPLRSAADWRRFAGKQANVLSAALGGRIEAEIIGVEGEPGAESVLLRTKRGEEKRVALAEVKEARLAFHWKR